MTEATGQEMTITRVFEAPRELVWKAWTEPERFAQWFGGRDSTVPLETASMDVRPGGAWSVVMIDGPERREIPFAGDYVEAAEPERLVLTFKDPSDHSSPNVEVLTVTFTDLGGKTEVVAHQAGNMPEEQYRRLEDGYGTFFDQLAEHLKQA